MTSLLKLFRFAKEYAAKIIFSLILLVFSQGILLFQPKIIEIIIDNGVKNKDLFITLLGAGGILFAAIAGFFLQVGSGFLRIKAAQGVAYHMRNNLFKKIMSFSFAALDKWRTGELIVRATSDITTITRFMRMGLHFVFQSFIMLTGCLVFMFLTNVQLALIMVIILPLLLILFALMTHFIRPLFLMVREKLDILNNILQENLAGAKVVRAFARQSYEMEKFTGHNEVFLKSSLKVGYTISIVFPFLLFAGQIILAITLWAGGRLVIENMVNPSDYGLTLGKLVAFMNYASIAIFPIIMLGMVLGFISMAAASAERIEEIFREPRTLHESDHPIKLEKFRGAISFHDVSFHYGNGEEVFSHINLDIQAGEKIGIIGTTGAGKSTLVHLIPRFFDPTRGKITVDGIDCRDLAFESLRTKIAIVFQDIVLFSGSIKENILFGNPSADEKDIARAADIACACEFIMKKDGTWDEPVGERGTGLSGGQRQRIAIARAVVSNPDILILDDVTSSVDTETEKTLIGNLFREFAQKTIIIISQKITTIQNADRIIVIDKGDIAGTGSHRELAASNEIYQEIVETQGATLFT
jgi:ATP-binding cassette, subfamily B, multidrug efflux pump